MFDYLEIREGGAEGPLVGRWAPTLHQLQVLWLGHPASLHLVRQPAPPHLPLRLLHRPLGLPSGLRGCLRGGVLRSQRRRLLPLPPWLLPKVESARGASTIQSNTVQPIPTHTSPATAGASTSSQLRLAPSYRQTSCKDLAPSNNSWLHPVLQLHLPPSIHSWLWSIPRDFDIEEGHVGVCHWDYLEVGLHYTSLLSTPQVRDGDSGNSSLLGRYCGDPTQVNTPPDTL